MQIILPITTRQAMQWTCQRRFVKFRYAKRRTRNKILLPLEIAAGKSNESLNKNVENRVEYKKHKKMKFSTNFSNIFEDDFLQNYFKTLETFETN